MKRPLRITDDGFWIDPSMLGSLRELETAGTSGLESFYDVVSLYELLFMRVCGGFFVSNFCIVRPLLPFPPPLLVVVVFLLPFKVFPLSLMPRL